ncbi:hypothetical protein QBC44DRAFT_393652 [Cladorrhinum sp. PSN332]|nr:hypothetical protein QBC44DRAFT_393652 [Cladorrhinum sp. PSN332]
MFKESFTNKSANKAKQCPWPRSQAEDAANDIMARNQQSIEGLGRLDYLRPDVSNRGIPWSSLPPLHPQNAQAPTKQPSPPIMWFSNEPAQPARAKPYAGLIRDWEDAQLYITEYRYGPKPDPCILPELSRAAQRDHVEEICEAMFDFTNVAVNSLRHYGIRRMKNIEREMLAWRLLHMIYHAQLHQKPTANARKPWPGETLGGQLVYMVPIEFFRTFRGRLDAVLGALRRCKEYVGRFRLFNDREMIGLVTQPTYTSNLRANMAAASNRPGRLVRHRQNQMAFRH